MPQSNFFGEENAPIVVKKRKGKPLVVGRNIPQAKLMKENVKLCGTNDFTLLLSFMNVAKLMKENSIVKPFVLQSM